MFEVEPTGEAGVRVKHLRKEFPRWGQDPVKAVQDVSFAAFPGKITLPSWASTWPDTSASSPPSPIIILIIFDSVIIFSLLIRRNHSAAGSQWRRQDDHHVCTYRSLLFFTVCFNHKHISHSLNNIITIIFMPTGLFSPTSGDAMVGGHSIREGMDQVKDLMNLT